MQYQIAKAVQKVLLADLERASQSLKAYPKSGPMGLTPDDVKFSPEFRADKKRYNQAFDALREFNKRFTKTFAKEIRADRHLRYE